MVASIAILRIRGQCCCLVTLVFTNLHGDSYSQPENAGPGKPVFAKS